MLRKIGEGTSHRSRFYYTNKPVIPHKPSEAPGAEEGADAGPTPKSASGGAVGPTPHRVRLSRPCSQNFRMRGLSAGCRTAGFQPAYSPPRDLCPPLGGGPILLRKIGEGTSHRSRFYDTNKPVIPHKPSEAPGAEEGADAGPTPKSASGGALGPTPHRVRLSRPCSQNFRMRGLSAGCRTAGFQPAYSPPRDLCPPLGGGPILLRKIGEGTSHCSRFYYTNKPVIPHKPSEAPSAEEGADAGPTPKSASGGAVGPTPHRVRLSRPCSQNFRMRGLSAGCRSAGLLARIFAAA